MAWLAAAAAAAACLPITFLGTMSLLIGTAHSQGGASIIHAQNYAKPV